MVVTFDEMIFKAKTIIMRLLKSVTKSYSYRVMASSWGGVECGMRARPQAGGWPANRALYDVCTTSL